MTEHSPWMTGSELVRARRLDADTAAEFASLSESDQDLARRYSEYCKRQGVIHDCSDVRPRPADEVGVDRHRGEDDGDDYIWPLSDSDNELEGFSDDFSKYEGRIFWWDREA